MQKFIMVLALATCGATFAFASTQYSTQRPVKNSVIDELKLSEAKDKAVKATLLNAERKKSLILLQAREQLEELEIEKANRLAKILTDEELKDFNQLESELHKEYLQKQK